MNDKKLNCKNCEYKYCRFRGSDREISAYFCEDYDLAEGWHIYSEMFLQNWHEENE